jgi:hypothetical protein
VSVVDQARGTAGLPRLAITADLIDPGRVNIFERWERKRPPRPFAAAAPAISAPPWTTVFSRLTKVSVMPWFRRREHGSRSQDDPEESIEVGGDRIVFWKAKSEEVEGEIYGPIWIADANDPDVTLEEHDEWLSWEQAQEFAQKRGLPFDEV